VFVAGLRSIDRVRGGGWLDCPNCGEHASQDVVDEMRFLGLLGYRFTTVGRRRVLVCRRCGFRRTAGGVELGRLNTGGRRIQRAWLVPIGLLPFAAVAAAALFILGRHPAGIEDTLSFTRDSAQPVAPVSLRRPLSWNASPEADSTPPDYAVSDPTQRMVFKLRRITDSGSLAQLLAMHYMDDNGINDTGVPESPPGATTVQIAGGTGLMIRFAYSSTGEPAQTTLYAFFHDETPAPCPSPSPSSGATAAATATPAATPSATFPGFATSPQPCVGGVGAETPPSSPSASPSGH
jgi:hypothetical protein